MRKPVPARRHGFAHAKPPPAQSSLALSVPREVLPPSQVGPVQLRPAVVQAEPSGLALAPALLQRPSQVLGAGFGRPAFRAAAASAAPTRAFPPRQAPLPNLPSLRPAPSSLRTDQARLRSHRLRPPPRLRVPVPAVRMREPPAPGRRDEPGMWDEPREECGTRTFRRRLFRGLCNLRFGNVFDFAPFG